MKRFVESGRERLKARSRRPLHFNTLEREKRRNIMDLRPTLCLDCKRLAFEVDCTVVIVHRVLRILGLNWGRDEDAMEVLRALAFEH